jgi:FkbM family methyltransferase
MKIAHNCQINDLNSIYEKYFGNALGVFVEVGAYDGYNFSNTWGLAEAGWSGLYFEPVPEFANKCREMHKDNDVKVIQSAIGGYVGMINLHLGGTVTSGSDWHVNTNIWKNEYHGEITVPIMTLDYALTRENTVGMDLLVIDVEGMEADVLKGFSIDTFKPKMVIVETHEKSEFKELGVQSPFINAYFDEHGYIKIHSDEINNIYVLPD